MRRDVVLKNPATDQQRVIKIGRNWPVFLLGPLACFYYACCGYSRFFWYGIIQIFCILMLEYQTSFIRMTRMLGGSEFCLFAFFFYSVFPVYFFVWCCEKGNKCLAMELFSNGWIFAFPERDNTAKAVVEWGMAPVFAISQANDSLWQGWLFPSNMLLGVYNCILPVSNVQICLLKYGVGVYQADKKKYPLKWVVKDHHLFLQITFKYSGESKSYLGAIQSKGIFLVGKNIFVRQEL